MKKRHLTRKVKRAPEKAYISIRGDEKLSGIASSMGISRQAVSQTLRRGLRKFYYSVQNLDNSWTPFQVASIMSQMLNSDHSIQDLKSFIGMLPKDIRGIVIADAEKWANRC